MRASDGQTLLLSLARDAPTYQIQIMKKIISPAVREEAEYICDVTGKPAHGKLLVTFGYGSHHDTQVLEMDLSDEAADEIIQFLKAKSPGIKLQDRPMHSYPLCHRR